MEVGCEKVIGSGEAYVLLLSHLRPPPLFVSVRLCLDILKDDSGREVEGISNLIALEELSDHKKILFQSTVYIFGS